MNLQRNAPLFERFYVDFMHEGRRGYEEFLATVYEAEQEQNELKDLEQQIESLATIRKGAMVGSVKTKSDRGSFLPKEERSA